MFSNYFLVGPGTVVLYEKNTITEMNSTCRSSESTTSDEEFGTVNENYLFFIYNVFHLLFFF
jgi:hypothetical protein